MSKTFELVAGKIAATQKLLMSLVAVAILIAGIDIASAHLALQATKEEARKASTLADASQNAVSRLRSLLHSLYPDRTYGDRQRMTLMLNDIRRARRALEAEQGVDEKLSQYAIDVLPSEIRLSLNEALKPLSSALYFHGPKPGDDQMGNVLLLNVNVNEIAPETALQQLPIAYVAALLFATQSYPPKLADLLERFLVSADPSSIEAVTRLKQSALAMQQELAVIETRFVNARGTTSRTLAEHLLDEYQRWTGQPVQEASESAARSLRYSSPTLDSLGQLLTEIQLAYLTQKNASTGRNPIEVPGLTLRLPAQLFLILLPAAMIALLVDRWRWCRIGRTIPIPKNFSALDASIRFGYLPVRLMGSPAQVGRAAALAQTAITTLAPIATAIVLAMTSKWGSQTLWWTLPMLALICAMELRAARQLLA